MVLHIAPCPFRFGMKPMGEFNTSAAHASQSVAEGDRPHDSEPIATMPAAQGREGRVGRSAARARGA
jgi:hypothetical protein